MVEKHNDTLKSPIHSGKNSRSGLRRHKHRSPLINNSNHSLGSRKRRGVGAIIGGTLLAVILFTTIFVYFMTVLQTQTEKGKADMLSSTAQEEKQMEVFKVSPATCGASPCTTDFLMVVNNTGPNPLNATHAVVFPVDNPADRAITPLSLVVASSDPTKQVLNPGESAIYSVPATSDGSPVNSSKSYHVDILSSRGNIVSAMLTPEDISGGGGGGGGGSNGGGSPPDFSISAFPNSMVVNPGNSGSSSISLTSLNGFSDSISLSRSGLPSGAIGSFAPPSPLSLLSGGSVSTDLTISTSSGTPTGTYTITVTGTNGTLTHSTQISLTVFRSGGSPDFALSANPNSVIVQPGGSGSSQLTVTSLNSFSGSVSFDPVAGAPSGASANILPNSISVASGGSSGSILQITTSSSTPIGTYPLDITAHSGSLTHATQVSLTVLAATPGAGQNNTGTNIGTGQGNVYAGMSGEVLQFKRLAQGSGITIAETGDTITITNTQGAGSAGEVNDGQVLGCALTSPLPAGCANVYAGKVGTHLQFSSLKAGTGITLTSDGNGNWVIDATTLATVFNAQNVGGGPGQVYRDQTSGTLNFRTLHGSNGIEVSTNGNLVEIASDQDSSLILRPQIQAIFPNPFGLTTGATKSLWGAVIANPSDHPMYIRKIVITAHDPSLTSGNILCNNNIVAITPATTWTCEGQGSTWNVMQWKASGSALLIPAHGAQLFLAQTGSPATASSNDRPSTALNFNVYTDFGQFTKVGYDFGVKGGTGAAGNHPMVNTFLSTALADKTPSNVIGVVNVQSGQAVTVRASIANYIPSTTVDTNAALIIDVPKAFTGVAITSSVGFNSPCAPQTFVDGSTQIKCTLPAGALNTAGAISSSNVKTIEFTMTGPTVTSTKEYLLYVLGDGTTDGGTFTLGPVSENVIRVTP